MYHKYTVIDKIMTEYYLVYKDRIIIRSYTGYRDEMNNKKLKKICVMEIYGI